jgi:hypothetical protein
MAISKKFQHGDIIIFSDEEGILLGRVIKGHKLIGAKWQGLYKKAVNGASRDNNYRDSWVIVDWFDPFSIDWMPEELVRLATQAEIVLYGNHKV